MIKIILICLAIAGLYYMGYTYGFDAGYDQGQSDELERLSLKNMEAVLKASQKHKLTYAGNLINAETGKETSIPYYHMEVSNEE